MNLKTGLKSIIKKITKHKTTYKIGQHEILIPKGHALPIYQKKYKLYDRFLPILCKKISSNKIIIDVGANIGDTTIAITQECENPIFFFYLSSLYFPYLEKNILHYTDKNKIKIFKNFIGTGLYSGELNHTLNGTASVNISKKTTSSMPIRLDKIIEDHSEIILIKVDVDGFDYDVLNSAEKILKESQPILYWENDINEDFQVSGFKDLYLQLSKIGYNHIFIFDNFGNFITEESNFETLTKLNSYVYSMAKNSQNRTIYYTDILATTDQNYSVAKESIEEYKKI